MQGSDVVESNISKLRKGSVGNVDISSICQMLKHYREISGENYKINLVGPLSNYYSSKEVGDITFRDNIFHIVLNKSGLLGTSGTLPRMLNIPITNDRNDGMMAGTEFLQIFENRFYELSVVASNKYNILKQKEEESFSKRNASYKISDLLATLYGVTINSEFKYLDKRSLIKYSNFLGNYSCNIDCLLKMLRDYFSMNFEAEYTVMQKKLLSEQVVTRIGVKKSQNNSLGINTQIGKKALIYGQYVDINIVVDNYDQYLYIYDTPHFLDAVKELITFYVKDSFVYSLYVVVDSSYLPKLEYSKYRKNLLLGRNTCFASKKAQNLIRIHIK